MLKLVDKSDSKSGDESRVGSSPTGGTNNISLVQLAE